LNRGAVLILGLLLLQACGSSPDAAPPPIVLISIDTLRSDRLPAYGYDGVATPAIDELRADGILFERAYSHIPLTLPAHASMLTGLLPPEHGVRDNLGYPLAASDGPWLPNLLKARGYRLGAAVSSMVLRAESGLGEDFEFFEDSLEVESLEGAATPERPGGETLDALLPWLETVADEPFFLLFHLYEPHRPYTPPEPHAARYGATYEGEIASADEVVGRLLGELRRLGIYERAVVTLTSDHGEGLGDHGEIDHGIFLYREALQVPLLIKLPGAARAGETVTAVSQLADLAPTFLDLAGLPVPEAMRGAALLSRHKDASPRTVYAESYIPRLHFGWSDLLASIDERYYFIDSPQPQLFDVVEDPGQRRDLVAELPEVARTMRRRLAAERRDAGPPGAFDDRALAQLAALGYTGGVRSRYTGTLPAPQTQTHLIEKLTRGRKHLAGQQWEQAAATFREIVDENPYMVFAWQSLTNALLELGRFEPAVAAARQVIELAGEEPQILLPMARALAQLRRFDEARVAAGAAASRYPAPARALLAEVAFAQGDLERAELEARGAIEADDSAVGPWLTLARIARRRGQGARALERVHEAKRRGDERAVRGLLLVEGAALSDMGRDAEAEAALLGELRNYPDSLRAYRYLAELYAKAGRGAEVGKILQELVEKNPVPRAFAVGVRTLAGLGDRAAAAALLSHALERFPESSELRRLESGSGRSVP
jgi:arylsulfatase A-like enzyme